MSTNVAFHMCLSVDTLYNEPTWLLSSVVCITSGKHTITASFQIVTCSHHDKSANCSLGITHDQDLSCSFCNVIEKNGEN